jgi:hypothetical protein
MGQERKVYKILAGKPEGKRTLGKPRRRREDGIHKVWRQSITWSSPSPEKNLCARNGIWSSDRLLLASRRHPLHPVIKHTFRNFKDVREINDCVMCLSFCALVCFAEFYTNYFEHETMLAVVVTIVCVSFVNMCVIVFVSIVILFLCLAASEENMQ